MTALSYGPMRAAIEERPEAVRPRAKKLALSMLGALVLAGCAASSVPLRSAGSALAPRLVTPPHGGRCSERALANKRLWAGAIVARVPVEQELTGRRLVREEWALCGGLDTEQCFDWARNAGTERGRAEGLLVDVEQGSTRRGRLWTFDLGHENVAFLFSTNQELVSYLRPYRARDQAHPAILDVAEAVEPRFHRMVVRYFEPERPVRTPASIWTIEFERSEQGASDALLAVADLEREGIAIEAGSRAVFADAARDAARGVLTLPFTGHAAPPDGPPVSAELLVYCPID